MTVAEVDLGFLSDILDGIQASDGMSAYITTKDGRLVGHVDRELLTRATDLAGLPQVAALAQSGPSAR